MAMFQYLNRSLRWSRKLPCLKNGFLLGARYGKTQLGYQTTYAVENNETAREPSNSRRPFEEIPHDRRLPIVSTIMDVYDLLTRRKLKNSHLEHYKTFKRHGRIAVIQVINKKLVVLSDPDICAEVCRQEERNPRRKEANEHFLREMNDSRKRHNMPTGLTAREGEEWRELRTIFDKTFMNPKAVKSYFEGFNDIAQLVIRHIKDKVGKAGHIEDFTPIVNRWALESFGTFGFGKNIGLFSEHKDEKMEKCFELALDYLRIGNSFSVNPIMKKLLRKKYDEFHKSTKQISDLGMEMMKDDVKSILDGSWVERENQRLVEKSFLADLLKKNDMPYQSAITYSLDMLRVSLDTTSSAVTWMVYLLGTHPEAQEKLYEEVQRNISADGKADYDKMQRMPYLRACFKEQQRLYPTTPGVPRVFKDAVSAGEYEIPGKTVILLNTYNMGRQEKLFADPHLFLPERWLRKKDRGTNERIFEKPHPFASLPFGHGSRSCIGRRVAEAEIQTLLSHLIKNFTFRYHGPEANGVTAPLLAIEHPLALTLQQRV